MSASKSKVEEVPVDRDSAETEDANDLDTFLVLQSITKATFDHFRNYTICSVIYIAGREARTDPAWELFSPLVMALAVVLAILNSSFVVYTLWIYLDAERISGIKRRRFGKGSLRIWAIVIYLAVVYVIVGFTVNVRISS